MPTGVYKRTEKHRKSLSDALKGGPPNKTSFKKGNVPWNVGTKGIQKATSGSFKKGHKINLGKKNHLGKKHTEKTKEKMRLKRVEIMKAGINQKETKPEKIMKDILEKKNIKYEQQWRYKYGIADFYLPDYSTIIEVDGEYWHSRPEVKERDRRQTFWLKNNGYNIIRIPSNDLIENDIKRQTEITQKLDCAFLRVPI